MTRRLIAPLVVLMLSVRVFGQAVTKQHATELLGLGDLPGGAQESHAKAVSSRGFVVGTSRTETDMKAFRWTRSEGMIALSHPEQATDCTAQDVSSDGSVIVGLCSFPGGIRAVWWSRTGEIQYLEPAGVKSFVEGVSADGRVAIGAVERDAAWTSSRWSIPEVRRSRLPADVPFSQAYGVSADGQVIVGVWTSRTGKEAFRWVAGSTPVGLGDLPGGEFYSAAQDVSADGLVVVGNSKSEHTAGNSTEAFRWDAINGMRGLGDLPGGKYDSHAIATNVDGTIVVGWGTTEAGSQAFIWDSRDGIRNLRDVLDREGANLAGWKLTSALDISHDGSRIVGAGVNPKGKREAWIAFRRFD